MSEANEPPSDAPLPPAAARLVAVLSVVALGLLVAGGRWIDVGPVAVLDPAVLLLAAIGAGSTAFPLRLRREGVPVVFSFLAAATFGIAMVAADVLAVAVAVVVVAGGRAIMTRSLVRTAFDTARLTISFTVALLAARALTGGELGGDVFAPAVLVAVATAVVVHGGVSLLLLNELEHRVARTPRRVQWRGTARLSWILAGDYLITILLTVLADRSAVAILLAVPMYAALLVGHRGYVADRAAGRQAELLRGTSRRLLDGARDDAALHHAIGSLRDLFGSEEAVLVADGDDGPLWLQPVIAEVHRTGRPVQRRTDAGVLAAPVRLEGRVVGAVAVAGRKRSRGWGAAELDLLSTIAGEIAATFRTRRLLEQVERERARLAAETSKLTDVLASASDGIVVLDADGRVEACNPAMLDITGRQGVPTGVPWRDVLSLEDETGAELDPAHPLLVALCGGARTEQATVALRGADGSQRWLRCSAAPVRSDGQRDGVVLVAVDVTREHDVDQLRGDFIATVSHELRTPLTPLRGFLGVLREHGGALDDDRRGKMVEAMETQVGRLSDLIGDLLEVAEIDRSAASVRREQVDIGQLVEQFIESERLVDDQCDRLDVRVAPVTAVADPVAVRRILLALVSNGIKHTDSTVTIRTHREAAHAVLRVSDAGPGVPWDARKAIFEPFHRLGNHLHRTQGPGLGLPVARSLAEALDGTLELEQRERPGCAFVLRLPLAPEPAVRAVPPLSGVRTVSDAV